MPEPGPPDVPGTPGPPHPPRTPDVPGTPDPPGPPDTPDDAVSGALHLGLGLSSAATTCEVRSLVDAVLRAADAELAKVVSVATIERLAADPRLTALGRPVNGWPAERLATAGAPTASERVEALTGTPSVAEAAALLDAGPGATLVVGRRASAHATVALARGSARRGAP